MFSQTAEYALRAMVFLAERAPERWTTKQIAEATRIPGGYLAKVMQGLARRGLVVAQRGRDGGFALVRKPDEVSILEILEAVDPLKRIRRCPLDLPEHQHALCPLHQRLDDAMAHIEGTFERTSVQDMMDENTFPVPGDSEISPADRAV